MSLQGVSAEQHRFVKGVFRRLLPEGKTLAFGSRVLGSARQYSDLDVALDANGTEVPLAILAQIREIFENSDLPFRVDVIDLATLGGEFRDLVKKQGVPL